VPTIKIALIIWVIFAGDFFNFS